MNGDNLVTVCGNVAVEPKLRRLDDGADVCSFRIASTPRRFDRPSGQWVDGPTSWFSVTAWRGLGVNCSESIRKGERVIVQGRLHTRDWTSEDGRSGTSVEITATAVGHDLTWGRSAFSRVVRTVEVTSPERAQADALVDEIEGRDGVSLSLDDLHDLDELEGSLRDASDDDAEPLGV